METAQYLTDEEVSQRLRGLVSVGTLRNWRFLRIGPRYIKIGKAVLYPLEQLLAWEHAQLVDCRPNPSARKDDASTAPKDGKDKAITEEGAGDE